MLANISGEAALAQSLALRCAKDLAASLDWVGAQEVLSSQESLMVTHGNTADKNVLCFKNLLGPHAVGLSLLNYLTLGRSTGCTSAPRSCWPPCWMTLRLHLRPARPVTCGRRPANVTSASETA